MMRFQENQFKMLSIISTSDYNERQDAAFELVRLQNEGWQVSVKRLMGQEIVLLQPPSGRLEDVIVEQDLVMALQTKKHMYG